MRYAILIGAVIVAILAYTAFWFHLAGRTEETVTALADNAAARGVDISLSDVEISGYPFRLVTRIGKLDWTLPTLAAPVRWTSDNLLIVREPWNRDHIILVVDGDQTLSVDGEEGEARYVLSNSRARASVVVPKGRGARLSLALEDAIVDAVNTDQRLTAETAELHLRQIMPGPAEAAETPASGAEESGVGEENPDVSKEEGGREIEGGAGRDPSLPASNQLAFQFTGVTLPDGKGGRLGRDISLIRGQAQVNGGVAGPTPALLQAWAQNGGTMEVTGLKIDWGPFKLEAAGTITLDEDNRPLGAFEARVKGMDTVIQALEETGQLRSEYAELARTALGPMQDRAQDGWVTVPFAMQNGFLYMGPIPLAVLSSIGPSR